VRSKLVFAIGCLALVPLTVSCSSEAPSEPPVGRVKLTAAGEIFYENERVTLSQLEQRLRMLAQENGVVMYYRANPAGEPPAGAQEVFEALMAARLPISLSSKPDFSDYIDEDGNSRPRE